MTNATKLLMLLAVLTSPLALADQPSVPTTADSRLLANPPDGEVPGLPRPGPVPGSRKTVLKVHPLPMLGGMALSLMAANNTLLLLPVEMEYAVTPNFSVSGMVVPTLIENARLSAAGFGLNAGVRLYLTGQAPDGFWLGGRLDSAVLMTESAGSVGFDFQPHVGYQWVHDSGFTVGVSAGLSVLSLASGQFPLAFTVPVGFAW